MKRLIFIFLLILSVEFIYPRTVKIYPSAKKQSSGIYLKKGDYVSINVSGEWSLWDKYDSVGGEGHNFIANEYGSWGVLLGSIGNSEPFTIGKGVSITSNYDGILYLFPNKSKYKIQNPSGYLEVDIQGGENIEAFKEELRSNAEVFKVNSSDNILTTDIYINRGERFLIYAFGEWTMWEDFFSSVSADGHAFEAEGINWGKLYAGIGTSYGEFLESYPIGERNEIVAEKSGILSLYPYVDGYKTRKTGDMEVYVIGGKKLSKSLIQKEDKKITEYYQTLAVSKINQIRTGMMLNKVLVNQELFDAANEHAFYMVKNNSFSKLEDEGKDGYQGRTLEERLNKKGFLFQSYEMLCQAESEEEAIETFMNSIYHRARIINPYLRYIGYGLNKIGDKTIHVFDFGYLDVNQADYDWNYICYPYNEASEVKTSWDGKESPSAFEKKPKNMLGYPVSIYFQKKLKSVENARLMNEAGSIVECYLITPETDINKKIDNGIVLIPKEPLDRKSKYEVTVEVIFEKEKESSNFNWVFLTAQ